MRLPPWSSLSKSSPPAAGIGAVGGIGGNSPEGIGVGAGSTSGEGNGDGSGVGDGDGDGDGEAATEGAIVGWGVS